MLVHLQRKGVSTASLVILKPAQSERRKRHELPDGSAVGVSVGAVKAHLCPGWSVWPAT